jgi:hypothetical protein
MLYVYLRSGVPYRNNIKAAFSVADFVFKQIPFCNLADLVLFLRRYGFMRLAECLRPPRLHFREYQYSAIFRNNIDLPPFKPEITLKNPVSFFPEILNSGILPKCSLCPQVGFQRLSQRCDAKAFPVDIARTEFSDCFNVIARAVPLVLCEAVLGIPVMVLHHEPIPGDLGDN